jgi:hypothetical protein
MENCIKNRDIFQIFSIKSPFGGLKLFMMDRITKNDYDLSPDQRLIQLNKTDLQPNPD